jgi:hypothetical protein
MCFQLKDMLIPRYIIISDKIVMVLTWNEIPT